MILRQMAIHTQEHPAPVAGKRQTGEFTPAVLAKPVTRLVLIVMTMPVAVVVLGKVMVRAVNVPASPARKGEFVKNFPAIVATAH